MPSTTRDSILVGKSAQKLALALVAAGIVSACTVGPDFKHPALPENAGYSPNPVSLPKLDLPASMPAGSDQQFHSPADISATWWELFHSQALNDVVVASIAHNPNIAAAQAALRNALENTYAQEGAYFPSVDANFQPTRQKVAGTLASPASSGASYYNLHTAQVTVSYVPDVFGANRRQVESLTAQADAQRFQLEATYLTLTSNVVAAAIQEASLRAQLRATGEIIADQTKVLTIFRREFQLGQVAAADVAAQEAALAQAETLLPPLEKQLIQQRDLLSTLAGQFPNEEVAGRFELDALELPTDLPLTLPAKLVEQRPDVRAAEAQLHAASAQIGVAVAARLPNIQLGVNAYGTAAHSLSELFTSGTGFWILAGNVTQPIFQGGTLVHRQHAAEAAYDQAGAQYRATVLAAFQNVADTLQALRADALLLAADTKAERASARSFEIANRAFELGNISSLTLLNAEQSYLQSRVALVQSEAARFADTAALFLALGGGWWNRTNATEAATGTPR